LRNLLIDKEYADVRQAAISGLIKAGLDAAGVQLILGRLEVDESAWKGYQFDQVAMALPSSSVVRDALQKMALEAKSEPIRTRALIAMCEKFSDDPSTQKFVRFVRDDDTSAEMRTIAERYLLESSMRV
jgi:HEAT repeat protein